jgi:hypothetical protein
MPLCFLVRHHLHYHFLLTHSAITTLLLIPSTIHTLLTHKLSSGFSHTHLLVHLFQIPIG